MEVFIKSAGRACYLERCIRSLITHLAGSYRITILDDGTNPLYLERIQSSFPEVISRSDSYDAKRAAIDSHIRGVKKYSSSVIPVRFWQEAIGRSESEHFLLMEEDGWLTQPVNADEIDSIMRQEKLVTLKLYWDTEAMVRGTKQRISPTIERVSPDIPVRSLLLMTPFLQNRLKIRSFALRLGLLPSHHLRPYYALYTVAGAFFSRAYWSYIWHNARDTVHESDQLLNALRWVHRHPESGFAKTIHRAATTTYQTSTHNHLAGTPFDMVYFNHVMNEAWFSERLDSFSGFPGDFPADRIRDVLDKAGPGPWGHASFDDWIAWTRAFRAEFFDPGQGPSPV